MDPQAMEFLRLLDQQGDQADSRKVGEEMGLDRGRIDTLSVDLMSGGLLEMVSLSGQVRLTDAGRQALGGLSAGGAPGGGGLAELLDAVAGADLGLDAATAGDLAVDLDTLRAQLKRSRPLAQVVSACLGALAEALGKSSAPPAAGLAKRAKELAG